MKDVLAKKIYDKYCEAVGGKAFNGDELPKSDEFFADPSKEKQANAWREAVKETEAMFLDAVRNLGHPAYEHSYGTREHIDTLREKAFDFLGIPKE